jgi:AcrR family transcriptional regulator
MDRRRTDTKDRMVRAAVDLYRRRGMTGTGFSEVLDQAGAKRGAIYHHFPGGKEELTVAVIESHNREVLGFLRFVLEKHPPGEAIRTLCARYADSLERSQMTFGCPIAPAVIEAGLTSDVVSGAAVAAFDSWRVVLSQALTRAQLPAERALSLAETIVAAIEGALILCRARRSAATLRDVGAELGRLLDDVTGSSGAAPHARDERQRPIR